MFYDYDEKLATVLATLVFFFFAGKFRENYSSKQIKNQGEREKNRE